MEMHEDQLQEAILGSLMIWPEEIDAVASSIKVEDFQRLKYQDTFKYLLENEGGDLVTVAMGLKGKVEAHELADWISREVSSVFLPRYCKQLKELSTKNKLFDLLGKVRLMASESTVQDMMEHLEKGVTILTGTTAKDPTGAKELVMDATRRLKKRYESRGVLQGIPYGIPKLDNVTCGMHRGELIVVAGRPSMGKSAFAGNILENSCREGYTGILFSLEMDKGNCVDRMLASSGGVHYGRLRSGMLQDSDWPRQTKACGEITVFKMFIDDTPGITLREIKSKCRKLKKNGLDVVVIDYLQLMGTNAALSNRVQAIGEISRGLKQMARELDCAVVLLSQLNRGVDGRPDKRPNMSDLRDSGEIEQDADVILFPFRPAAYCPDCKDNVTKEGHDPSEHKMMAEIIVEKQRNGERNLSVPVAWAGEFQKFVEVRA